MLATAIRLDHIGASARPIVGTGRLKFAVMSTNWPLVERDREFRTIQAALRGETTGCGVVLTGDALVTGHPLSAVEGPQLLRGFFHHDPAATPAALDVLASLPADVIGPGHGAPLEFPLDRAVAVARSR